MDNCIFCKIAAGKLPAEKILETDELMVIKDIAPTAPKHVLVIPKAHIEKMSDLKDDQGALMGKLMLAARDAARQLKIVNAFKLKIFNGKRAGQTVFHLHVHVMGGWKGEGGVGHN